MHTESNKSCLADGADDQLARQNSPLPPPAAARFGRFRKRNFLSVVAVLLGLAGLSAGQTPQLGHPDFQVSPEHPVGFRGDGSGRFPGATPPVAWDLAKGTGVKWNVAIPGKSVSSVIVVGKKVFATASPHHVVCLDAETGKQLWTKDVDPLSILAKDQAESLRKDLAALVVQLKATPTDKTLGKRVGELASKGAVDESLPYAGFMTLAPATPASDGQRVYVQFPAGVLAAYDLDGKEAWKIPAVPSGWIMGNSSPLVFKDRVVAICGARNSPTLLCVDSRTGKEHWKTTFPTADHCGAGSPAIVATQDGVKVVTPVFKMFDFQTGKEWRTHTYYTAIGATPIVDGQRVLHVHGDYGCKERSLVVIDCAKPFSNPSDGVSVILRKSSGHITGSPLLIGDKVYLPDGEGTTPEIINLSTGTTEVMVDKMKPLVKKAKSEANGYAFRPSPALAGGHIYQVLDDGQVLILDPSAPTKVVANNSLAPTCGSPFFVGKRIYFRTRDGVCCIGE